MSENFDLTAEDFPTFSEDLLSAAPPGWWEARTKDLEDAIGIALPALEGYLARIERPSPALETAVRALRAVSGEIE